MDTGRNLVISGEFHAALKKEGLDGGRFTELPPHLQGAARKVLKGRRAVKIARNATGAASGLAKWAKAQREAKERAKGRRRATNKAASKLRRRRT